MLNSQGPGKIDWCDWSWNPITGCLYKCSYCYMRAMENRFKNDCMKPKVHLDRLDDIAKSRKLKPGDKIFVSSSGDMFGDWVSKEHIQRVLDIAKSRPDLVFLFLTKNPAKYGDFELPKNGWYGTTVDGLTETKYNLPILSAFVPKDRLKFVSFEPMKKRIFLSQTFRRSFKTLSWVIVGIDSTRGVEKPPKLWVREILDTAKSFIIPVWMKDSLDNEMVYGDLLKEIPPLSSLHNYSSIVGDNFGESPIVKHIKKLRNQEVR